MSRQSTPNNKKAKCVVWDLDNTIWQGVLLENDDIILRNGIIDIIKTLDNRGILQSIASKNNYDDAMAKLKEFGLDEYFLYPQINWNSKATSMETIAQSINIGIDTLAFIDDQAFERDEVQFSHPNVLCIDAENIHNLLALPEMNPHFITTDSAQRRLMYQTDITRRQVEDNFVGPKDQFLASLNMVFTLAPAKKEDLQRAEELTMRTHQLNTTGYTYSYDELNAFRESEDHLLLIATLDDKYGTYGKIGLCLIECTSEIWTIKLLLMSCRVMSRGVGTVIINYLRDTAKKNNVRLQAELISNDRNRVMYITYKFAHFKEIKKINNLIVFENDLSQMQQFPGYLTLKLL